MNHEMTGSSPREDDIQHLPTISHLISIDVRHKSLGTEEPPQYNILDWRLLTAGWRQKIFHFVKRREGLDQKLSDMTSSVGKEGDDQYGDGRWLMMVRHFTVEICPGGHLSILLSAPKVYQRGQRWRARGSLGGRQSHSELIKFPDLGLQVRES